ncbi:L,D-transpeptidase family protein [Sphingomonas sp. CGMCC 1.13654]|uniref:L,D-transpeptidase family protein n=2 Tax=Sphingomonas chungangi TaxID=2683589 RepID=A0A838LCK0_9SPHN|nr:L,D-transpeptidase family protein [Sphingomonas chungangi]
MRHKVWLTAAIGIAALAPAVVRIADTVGGQADARPAPHQPVAKPAKVAAVVRPAKADDASYAVKRVLDVPEPMKIGDYVWNEDGAPKTGRIIITVDLAAGVMSVFRDGYEIGAAAIMYGADDHPTPLGVFAISQKDAHHVSNLYDAPMPYMMRLTNDGITIHGSKMRWNGATHGCVGVPEDFAHKVFDQVKLGDRVIVTKGEMLGVGEAIKAA